VAEGSVNDGDDTPSLRVMSLPHGWKNYEALMATLGGIADGRGSAASHSSPVGAA
jgi:hypothetical protein